MVSLHHVHQCTRAYHLGLPALAVAFLGIAWAPELWTYLPIFLAWLTSIAWVLLQWMVPKIDWITQNPFSEARCGPQNDAEDVRFVWVDTPDGYRLPLLHVNEPPDERGRRKVAEAMGRKLAPFAHDVVRCALCYPT